MFNLYKTAKHNLKDLDADPGLRFIGAGLVFWVIAMTQTIVGAIPAVNSLISFTLFTASRTELLFRGFFALTLFGAIHFILPRLCGSEWPSVKLTAVQFWCFLLGTFIAYLAKLLGGIGQGLLLNDAALPFDVVMKTTLLPLRISTVGYLLIAIGVVAFAINLGLMLLRKPNSAAPAISLARETSSSFQPLLCFGLGLTLILPWIEFVAGPLLQLGGLEPEKIIGSDTVLYPQTRPGLAAQGAQIYRANGCAACHTQQVRPATLASDLARGWGRRRTVARDYLFDQPILLGSQRIGPDLANIGLRQNADTLLLHLYDPQITAPKSIMPSYRFLFEIKKAGQEPSAEALKITGPLAPGTEVVPRSEAKALAAYLQSLRSDKMLYETPAPTALSSRPPELQPKGRTNSPAP